MKGERERVFREKREDESYVDYYTEMADLAPDTERNYNHAWRSLQEFKRIKEYDLEDIGHQEAIEFSKFLKQSGGDLEIRYSTAELYYYNLCKMVDWLKDHTDITFNPFTESIPEGKSPSDLFDYDNTTHKREVGLSELRSKVQSIKNPTLFIIVLTLLKTGLRIGELANLDERDIHLDHPIAEDFDNPRTEIANKPDALYVDSSISEGEVHNGEKRRDGDKPKSFRMVPIDEELKRALIWYMAMTPPSPSPANPVFVSEGKVERMTVTTLSRRIIDWAKDVELSEGRKRTDNVNAHWCRHWFSTTLTRNIGSEEVEVGTVKDYVGALRGDNDSKTIDIYIQGGWGDEEWKREAYTKNIPKLLTND